MLALGFPAAAFGTNCYVLAPAAGEECVVVDPGVGVEGPLVDLLQRYRLRPAAVLLTHGHLDHVYAVTPVCGGYGIAATVHGADRHRLVDPVGGLGPALAAALAAEFGPLRWQEPDDVVTVEDGASLDVAGLAVRVVHAPGHTEGSVLFLVERPGEADLCLAGDVLFAGSIGRTDLPGGDHGAMLRSLRERVLPLDDAVEVLPGHGPATTIGVERRTNPYLRALVGGSG
ncbi:MBL fold metallo-hydrolase [Kineococcus glutinatus]|uniref:MBL fold metallo-hydrolase n=1 Tax=Kineococcus glutinatus TaxID=1070872 RepID=A0ABP9I212_9ACTN